MGRLVTLRLSDVAFQELKRHAEVENRSLSNFIETATLQHIQELEFMSDEEMDGIRSNPKLLNRLKRGSKEVQKRTGRFVG